MILIVTVPSHCLSLTLHNPIFGELKEKHINNATLHVCTRSSNDNFAKLISLLNICLIKEDV